MQWIEAVYTMERPINSSLFTPPLPLNQGLKPTSRISFSSPPSDLHPPVLLRCTWGSENGFWGCGIYLNYRSYGTQNASFFTSAEASDPVMRKGLWT